MPEVNHDATRAQAEGDSGPRSEGSGAQGVSGAGSQWPAYADTPAGIADRTIRADPFGVADREVTLEEVAEYLEMGVGRERYSAYFRRAAARAIRLAIDPSNTVSAMANRVCSSLPEGFELRFCMERGAGWLELINVHGDVIALPAAADRTIDEQIEDALRNAC